MIMQNDLAHRASEIHWPVGFDPAKADGGESFKPYATVTGDIRPGYLPPGGARLLAHEEPDTTDHCACYDAGQCITLPGRYQHAPAEIDGCRCAATV